MLDWVSTEDGGHVLTVAVGAKVLLYAAVSAEVAQSTHKDNKSDSRTPRRGILQKSKSMTVSNVVEEIRWMKVGFILKNLDFCLLNLVGKCIIIVLLVPSQVAGVGRLITCLISPFYTHNIFRTSQYQFSSLILDP